MVPSYLITLFQKLLFEFPLIFVLVILFGGDENSIVDSIGLSLVGVLILWFFELIILIKKSVLKLLHYKFSKQKKESVNDVVNSLVELNFPRLSPTEDFQNIPLIFDQINLQNNSVECNIFSSRVTTMMTLYLHSEQYLTYYLYLKTMKESLKRYQEICLLREV